MNTEENNTELPEDWYEQVKNLFDLQVESEAIKSEIKPILVGITNSLGDKNYHLLIEKISALSADARQRIVVLQDENEIISEFKAFGKEVHREIANFPIIENRELITMSKSYKSKNSKGKYKPKGSKYF